jgi:hypothetical protein
MRSAADGSNNGNDSDGSNSGYDRTIEEFVWPSR